MILAKITLSIFSFKTAAILSLKQRTTQHSVMQHYNTVLTPSTYIHSITYTCLHLGKPLNSHKGLPTDKVVVNVYKLNILET